MWLIVFVSLLGGDIGYISVVSGIYATEEQCQTIVDDVVKTTIEAEGTGSEGLKTGQTQIHCAPVIQK
jgi:hypothetical protein